jgi:hypothetical protein
MRISVLKIDNIKLRTKILIPLALMAAGVLAVAAFGASRLARVSSTASEIIERRDLAAMVLAQASHLMTASQRLCWPTRRGFPARESSDSLRGGGFASRLAGSGVVLSRPVLDHSGIHCRDRATERPIQTDHSAIGFGAAAPFA